MIDKRLIGLAGKDGKYIAHTVLLQWCGLLAQIGLILAVTALLQGLLTKTADAGLFLTTAVVSAAAILVRLFCTVGASRSAHLSSKSVKKALRERIYRKLLRLGASYSAQVSTSEVVQLSVEGVGQLDTYFSAYLPQFFYSMLAPLTLFAALAFVSLPAAAVLLICVPLIPVSIAAVQTIAKKLLSRYWGQYTKLGDTFLENLQGLTTLKIYQADGYKNDEMNREAEAFRRITMKVLTMQLNSITLMDLVAYGGAALGVVMAVTQYHAGAVSAAGCLAVILLSAEFFIPMRRLGSFFHIAMNGAAAGDQIFRLLDLPEPVRKTGKIDPENCGVSCRGLRFSYDASREILHGIDLDCRQGGLNAVVGESGCGKSTLASVLTGRGKGYAGSVTIGGREISEISEESLMRHITYVGHDSYLFKGTVRENLLMGNPDADDETLWAALKQAGLADFLGSGQGLDAPLTEKASNLSGGQRQRLALARALLHDSPVYIFDEATSNIDVESENDIMERIHMLAQAKTVLLISHRLANVTAAKTIYVLCDGYVLESGTHQSLLACHGIYKRLWDAQQSLENYGKVGEPA